MAHVLKMFELADKDSVTQMDIGGSGIESGLHAQGRVGGKRFFETTFEFVFADDLDGAFAEVSELFGDRQESHKFEMRSSKCEVWLSS